MNFTKFPKNDEFKKFRDRRVDIDTVDGNKRKLEDVIGVAISDVKPEDKEEILGIIQSHRQWRIEEDGRRNSLEEENIDIDGLHRLKVFDKLKVEMVKGFFWETMLS